MHHHTETALKGIDTPGSFKSYAIGFVLSIVLTLASYLLVTENLLTGKTLVYTIVVLGLIQAVVQLIFFLHLAEESKPRWNLLVFLFMLLVLLIIVIGSLWIMYNLDYHMMMPMENGAHYKQ